MTLIVDTLRFSKLQDKGHFSAAQADTLAETIGTVGTEKLATKTDIAELRVTISEVKSELMAEIADLRTELRAEIAGLRTELKAEIADLRTELKADIADLKSEIADLRVEFKAEIGALWSEFQKWIIGAIGVQTLVMVSLVLTLARTMTK